MLIQQKIYVNTMFLKSLIIFCVFYWTAAQRPPGKQPPKGLVGGRDPQPGEVKYIVAVRSRKSVCGGGVIGEKFILTAAHCIKIDPETDKLLQPIRIIAGTTVASGYNKATVVKRNVSRAYFPTHYIHGGHDDIAVLELEQPLMLLKHHRKIRKLDLPQPLADDPSTYPTYENVPVQFAGYGNTHAEIVHNNGEVEIKRSGVGRLQVAAAMIHDARTCKNYFENSRDDEMCLSVIEDETRKKPQGTCTGDSGSPAVYNNSVLIGLDSKGKFCNNNWAPTLFTRVSSYIPFIKKAMSGDTDQLIFYDA